jgi:hypothetical protein
MEAAGSHSEQPGIRATNSVHDPGRERRGQGIVKRVLAVLTISGNHDQSAQNARVTGDKLGLPLATIHKSVLLVVLPGGRFA